jgi:hypothetical protein
MQYVVAFWHILLAAWMAVSFFQVRETCLRYGWCRTGITLAVASVVMVFFNVAFAAYVAVAGLE